MTSTAELQRLQNKLSAKKKELTAALNVASRAGNDAKIDEYTSALVEIDMAIDKLASSVTRANEMQAAEMEEAPAPRGRVRKLQAQEAPEVSEPAEGESEIEELPDSENSSDDEEEAAVSAVGENPVAMTATLRREMGNEAADFLDAYALGLHKRALVFLKKLMSRALDIEDQSKNGFRAVLLAEVGKRGVKKVEPLVGEWREALVRHLMKDVIAIFEVPEEDPSEGMDEELTDEEASESSDSEVSDSVEGELEASSAETPEAAIPPELLAAPIQVPSTGRISFVARDFKPSGMPAPSLE